MPGVPAPAPGSSRGPLTEEDLVQKLAAQVGGGKSSESTASKYGLGPWGSTEINPGDLPIFGTLIGKGKQTTGDNIVAAFAKASPVELAEMQRALYLGGFYGHTYTPRYGVIGAEDIKAFGQAVMVAGQSGSSVSDLLLSRAKYGTSAGIAAAQAAHSSVKSSAAAKAVAISVPATGDLEAQAMRAFEETLGRKAKPKEAAAFASMYQAMAAGIQRANALDEYQAAQQAAGGVGLSAKEAAGFQQQLGEVGQPRDEQVGAQPEREHQWWRGGTLGPATGPNTPAFTAHDVPIGFGEQLAELQTLGQSVRAAAAGKNPILGGGGGLNFIEEEQPVDPSVAAANFARNTHPKAAANTDLAGALDNFLALLGSRLGA